MTGRGLTVGIDLGGTGTRIAAVSDDGGVAGQRIVPTSNMAEAGGPEQAVRELARHVLATAGPPGRITAIGIGASGPVGADGVIRNDDTLPGFSHVPVCGILGTLLGTSCVIDNDTVTAAIGEFAHGAGQGVASLLVVTLGTGVGACALNHGHPHRGGDGLHPEAGHLPVPGSPAPCYCGLPACWEQKASRTALGRNCQAFLGPAARSPQESIDMTASRAASGDPDARDLFRRYGDDVGQGIGALSTTFRPSRVVIGGGAARYFDLFRAGTQQAISRRSPFEVTTDLRPAALGDLSGALGAAEMARSRR